MSRSSRFGHRMDARLVDQQAAHRGLVDPVEVPAVVVHHLCTIAVGNRSGCRDVPRHGKSGPSRHVTSRTIWRIRVVSSDELRVGPLGGPEPRPGRLRQLRRVRGARRGRVRGAQRRRLCGAQRRRVRGARRAVASASAASGGAACSESTAAGTVKVSIKDFAFNPAAITAKVGDVITFTNGDSAGHTATLDDGSCFTPTIAGGASDGLTFTAAGTYPFHCAIHATMMGTITVS